MSQKVQEGRGLTALALHTDLVELALVVGHVEDHLKPLAILIDRAQIVRLKSGFIEQRCLDHIRRQK